jgi:hypothetical protein
LPWLALAASEAISRIFFLTTAPESSSQDDLPTTAFPCGESKRAQPDSRRKNLIEDAGRPRWIQGWVLDVSGHPVIQPLPGPPGLVRKG